MSSKTHSKIVVFTDTRRDAESTELLLRDQGIETISYLNVDSVCSALSKGVSALIVAREAINEENFRKLSAAMATQPKWSHIPVILLITSEDLSAFPNILDILAPLGNLVLLERPVRVNTLLSAVRNALADRRRQYEVRDLLESLEASKNAALQAKEEADRANRSKSEFLANMSHEIRTPLGAVLGFTDLMALPDITQEERNSHARTIKRNGHLLSALIDDVLDLAKIESGKLAIEEIETSLNELLADVIASVQTRAQEKSIQIHIEKTIDVPNMLRTDPVRLKQIIINLMGNAIKFTSRGQIWIKIKRTVRLEDGKQRDHIVFTITDTGIGIALADQGKLFQAFSQADSTITRKFGGTGLGLVLSRRLARAMGGDLQLKSSTPGRGSVFEFSIEHHPSREVAAIAPSNTQSQPIDKDSMIGMRVLVADDSPDNQTLIRYILTREGIVVSTADDGEQALALATKENFDVILMDVQMPKLSGLDAVAELRRQGYKRPVVGLSAHAMAEDREKGLAVGCDAYLTKPIDKNQLLETLRSYR